MNEINVSLIIAIISASVAFYGYIYSKKKEREFSLAKTRQEIYQKLVSNLYERLRLLSDFQQDPKTKDLKTLKEIYAHIFKHNPELSKNITEMLEVNTLLCIYGTDEAIKATASFQKESAEAAQGIRKLPPDLPGLVLTLRRNIFSGVSNMKRTQVSKENIEQLLTM